MNVLVVHSLDIEAFPPVRNLISILAENGHNVTVLTRNKNNIYFQDAKRIRIIPLPENKYHSIFRIFNYLSRVRFLRREFDREMPKNDILWTTTDSTVRELKGRVFRCKHVMQLMELIDDIPEIQPFQFKKVNLKKYAQKAYKVVVPEYNRARIQKTWWDLKETPTVLPNKPVDEEIDMSKVPSEAVEIIDKLKQEKRKVILYQGVFGIDRNFELFAEAFKMLSDKVVFCLLGPDNNYRKKLCEQYPDIEYLGYLSPPYHLLITPYAYAALLTYLPSRKCGNQSVLNALYCAPNKIYEYAKFGIPMIGNDVPGLDLPFKLYNIGRIYHGSGVEEMKAVLNDIDNNYATLNDNCLEFYNSINLNRIVEDILK